MAAPTPSSTIPTRSRSAVAARALDVGGVGPGHVPTGVAGADLFPTPRACVERSDDVVSRTELPRGGHFLEWEALELVADDLRAFFRDRT